MRPSTCSTSLMPSAVLSRSTGFCPLKDLLGLLNQWVTLSGILKILSALVYKGRLFSGLNSDDLLTLEIYPKIMSTHISCAFLQWILSHFLCKDLQDSPILFE